jgi:hypothetical protein
MRGIDDVLRQLAFASRARPGLRPADTSDIIATSRTNNAREGVTGVLLYSGESFIQLVEGSDAAIAMLWRRLIVDDRHRGLSSLYGGAVAERAFSAWRAGYVAEASIGPMLVRWRGLAPALPEDEVERLRAFLRSAETF